MHSLEYKKTTNTVRLLKLIIPETELTLFGRLEGASELCIPDSVTPLVLYPEPSAPVLTKEFVEKCPKPIMLIVPDGTWTQAKKLIHRRENLYKVPRVRIQRYEPSQYFLRRNQEENGLCTLEAVAEALGAIEGSEIKNKLLHYLDMMVSRVIWTREGCNPQTFPGLKS